MLTIALIADNLTRAALAPEARILHVTPLNYRWLFRLHRPDFLFIESAWKGRWNQWEYHIATRPNGRPSSNARLLRVIEAAKEAGVPTVFWNKEDSVHFERFIDSARHCDHVFTVDALAIPRYRAVMGEAASVHPLLFAVQPRLHFPTFEAPRHRRANFVGSYSQRIHDTRRARQHMLFEAACHSGLGLDVYDRNSGRRSANYRYPAMEDLRVYPAVSYANTAPLYRDYLLNLNVNTIEDSPTMFSRRVVEVLACGGLLATTPSVAVEKLFGSYCHILHSTEEVYELCARLARDGYHAQDIAMRHDGAVAAMQSHSWAQRLIEIAELVL